MKTKLLKIIRANFDIAYSEHFIFAYKNEIKLFVPICSSSAFDVIVKMLERIYPQGKHYAIMRHSRRFKQARRERTKRTLEGISVSLVFLAIITILVLNTCCGSGEQY